VTSIVAGRMDSFVAFATFKAYSTFVVACLAFHTFVAFEAGTSFTFAAFHSFGMDSRTWVLQKAYQASPVQSCLD